MTRQIVFDREQILDKAMYVFWEKGYTQTSLQDLLNATGLSSSSLYNTFKNKPTLFNACFRHYYEKTSYRHEILLNAQHTKQGLRAYFKERIAASYSQPLGCMITNTAIEHVSFPQELQPEINSLLHDRFEGLEQAFFDLIERGKKKGEISQTVDSKAQAYLFLNLNHSINVMARAKVNREEIEHMIKTVIDSL